VVFQAISLGANKKPPPMPLRGNRVNDMKDGSAFVHASDEVL
jgi:hypothetical protein